MGFIKLLTVGGLGILYFIDLFKLADLKTTDGNGKRLLYERQIIYSAFAMRGASLFGLLLYLLAVVPLVIIIVSMYH